MVRAAFALLPRGTSNEEWLGLLGRRLTRAANVRWLVEHGDEGAEVSKREAGRSVLGGLQLRACLDCGDSEVLGAQMGLGPCPCGGFSHCVVRQAGRSSDAERLKEVVLRLHAELRPLWRFVPAVVCAPPWTALVAWLTLLQRSSGRISRGGCPSLPLLLGKQVVCLWAELHSTTRLRKLAHPGSYRLLGESSQECIFAEDAAGAGPGVSGWWTLGPTCKRCSRPLALESDIVISGSSTPPLCCICSS